MTNVTGAVGEIWWRNGGIKASEWAWCCCNTGNHTESLMELTKKEEIGRFVKMTLLFRLCCDRNQIRSVAQSLPASLVSAKAALKAMTFLKALDFVLHRSIGPWCYAMCRDHTDEDVVKETWRAWCMVGCWATDICPPLLRKTPFFLQKDTKPEPICPSENSCRMCAVNQTSGWGLDDQNPANTSSQRQ